MNTDYAINFNKNITLLATWMTENYIEACKSTSCEMCFANIVSDNCSVFQTKQAMLISVCATLMPNTSFFRLLALLHNNKPAGYKELEAKAEALVGLQPLLCKYFSELDAYHSEEDYIHLQTADELATEIRNILEI